MPVYHQMGHDSINLLSDSNLNQYAGAILSPINYEVDKVRKQIQDFKVRENFELIFDPQLYAGHHSRETLKQWSYFPKEIETADFSSLEWWDKVNSSIVDSLKELEPHSVCTPAPIPRTFSLEYYGTIVDVGNALAEKCSPLGISTLQTLLINIEMLANKKSIMEIASIASKVRGDRIYLIFITDIEPRRELSDSTILAGAMRLIHELKNADLNVTVGFSSTELVLWKTAGADSCATGKFFNLRRFTKSRFNEPEGGGGGQLPYWVEESLFSFLRQGDVARLEKIGKINFSNSSNPLALEIEKCIRANEAWLKHAWRHYMWWFADFEKRIHLDSSIGDNLLKLAEENWAELEGKNILMDEPKNSGHWLRPWRQAIREYKNI